MGRKVKTAAVNVVVPQDDAQARTMIRELGDKGREALRLEAEMNDKLAKIKDEYGAKVEPIDDQIAAMKEGLKIYCEANRDRLTKGGKVKHHRFSTGEISWRVRPAKVTLRGVDAVIEAIKSKGLSKKFLRVKTEVNKDAMLEKDARAKAAAIPGVTIGSDGEDFIVEPFETELTETA